MNFDNMKALNDIYVNILNNGMNLFENNEISSNKINELKNYCLYVLKMTENLQNIINISHDFVKQCEQKINELTVIVKDPKPINMLSNYKKIYNGMSWADMADMDDETEDVINKVKKILKNKNDLKYDITPLIYKNISNVYNKNIYTNYKIPVINDLKELPSSLYWYNGDKTNKSGIYICITKNVFVQVPFPNVVDGMIDSNKTRSIKCKYNTIEECLKIRQELSVLYNSEIRECKFAHTSEQYVKVGNIFRCMNLPRFGNHLFLKQDLDYILDDDIKNVLMYSLSDLLLSSIWFQHNKKNNIIMNNIDIC